MVHLFIFYPWQYPITTKIGNNPKNKIGNDFEIVKAKNNYDFRNFINNSYKKMNAPIGDRE